MTTFTKLDAIRRHLRLRGKTSGAVPRGKRVQKNLSLWEADATRLKALAARDGLSQARLFAAALDAYEQQFSRRPEPPTADSGS